MSSTASLDEGISETSWSLFLSSFPLLSHHPSHIVFPPTHPPHLTRSQLQLPGDREEILKKEKKGGQPGKKPGIHPAAAFAAYFIFLCSIIIKNHVTDIHMGMTIFNIKDQVMT